MDICCTKNSSGTRSWFANIEVYEIVYIQNYADVDTALRQKIEGYLAHKWGLAANLPIDHPYKTFAPRV